MDNNPNMQDTLKALDTASSGILGFIKVLSDKVTPDLVTSLSEEQRSRLEGQMKDLNNQTEKLAGVPDMLKKINEELQKHNL